MMTKKPLRLFRIVTGLAFVTALGYLASCGDGPGTPREQPYFPENFLQSYPMVRDCRFSIDHDMFRVRVYINPEAADAYMNGNYPFEPGTVCVKVLYSDEECSDVAGYVAMKKGASGTNPVSGDWEWQSIGAGRNVVESGNLNRCISCHSDCSNGRDFTCTDP